MRVAASIEDGLLRRRELARLGARRRLAIVAVLTASALACVAVVLLRDSSVFAVRAVSVSGAHGAVAREVRAAAAAAAGSGSLLALDPARVTSAVERLPEVRSATVDRDFPNTVAVTVAVYRPEALVRAGAGARAARYVVAADGHVVAAPQRFARRLARGLPRVVLPAGSALALGTASGDANLAAALRVLGSLPPGFVRRVGDVRTVTASSGIVTARVGRHLRLKLGDASGLPLKLRVAERVLVRFSGAQRRAVAYLDLSAPNRPALGMR